MCDSELNKLNTLFLLTALFKYCFPNYKRKKDKRAAQIKMLIYCLLYGLLEVSNIPPQKTKMIFGSVSDQSSEIGSTSFGFIGLAG